MSKPEEASATDPLAGVSAPEPARAPATADGVPGTEARWWRQPVLTAPGPAGGDMLRSFGRIRHDPLGFLADARAAYGPIVQFPIPAPPSYLVSDPDAVRRVLQANHKAYGKRTLQYDRLSLVTGEGLLTADTPVWRSQRPVVQPAFHASALAQLAEIVGSRTAQVASEWSELPDDAVVDVDEAMMELALVIVGEALFGTDLTAESADLAAATLDALDVVVARARNPIPVPGWLPSRGNRVLRAALAELDAAVDRIVRERGVEQSEAGGTEVADRLGAESPYGTDMLGLMLAAGMRGEELRNQIVTFIVAGHETVASALTWAWWLLATHPTVADAVAAEAVASAEAAAADGPLGHTSLAALPYTRAVVDETLRLYPPAWLITRQALAPDVLAGVEIPAGSLLIISPWIVHREKGPWDDPEAFRPERFIDPLTGEQRAAYLPFGAGPRLCIGRETALVEATLILAELGRRFSVAPVPGVEPTAVPLVTIRPAAGLPLRVRARQRS